MSDPKLAWQTGTIKVRSNDKDSHVSGSINELFEDGKYTDKEWVMVQRHAKLIVGIKEETKKAFWAGFEISHCLGGTDIQKKWNEYKDLKGL